MFHSRRNITHGGRKPCLFTFRSSMSITLRREFNICIYAPATKKKGSTLNSEWTRPIPWRDTRCWYAELKKETNTCTQCKYLAFGTFARCVWLPRYYYLPSSTFVFRPLLEVSIRAHNNLVSSWKYRARVWKS